MKASEGLRQKMLHTIFLLRKAEKVASRYDKENGFWLAFSGGKDSQAVFHMAQLAGVKFKAHFSPSSLDPPEVIRFIKKRYPEVEFMRIEKSIYQRFVELDCLPTQTIRWCCKEFKENFGVNKVVLVGVRRAEGSNRAKRNEVEVSHKKYSGDLDGFSSWSEGIRSRKWENKIKYRKIPKAKRKEYVVQCINKKDRIVVSPILYWTNEDVHEFLKCVVEVPSCELYEQGFHRIGCIACPMRRHSHILEDVKRWPHVKEKWIQAILQTMRNPQRKDGRPSYYSALHFAESVPVDGRPLEDVQRDIAENVFDWWISKKNVRQWYDGSFVGNVL